MESSTLDDNEVLAAAAMSHHRNDELQNPLFSELLELTPYKDGVHEWVQVQRWIKYEEIVEKEGQRWSKPHVSTVTLQGILEFRKMLKTGVAVMNLEAKNMRDVIEAVLIRLNKDGVIGEKQTSDKLKELMKLKHRHHFEGARKVDSSLGGVIKDLLIQKLEKAQPQRASGAADADVNGTQARSNESTKSVAEEEVDGKINTYLLKKIPTNCEAACIMVGRHRSITKPISAFVRLSNRVVFPDVPEVDIPTRFFYFLVVPENSKIQPNEVGSALGTAFADTVFKNLAYDAESKEDLLTAFDDFAAGVKALPRSWDAHQYIEPPADKVNPFQKDIEDEIDEDRRSRQESGLVRSGRVFGGLINDIKRKKKFYLSDFRDGLHPQVLSSFLFMYFALLAPIVAFGALLGKATEQRIATMESLMSGLICSVGFGLFSGQPLVLLGSTGPVYAFEKILYSLCETQGWDYLSLRLWIGLWISVFLFLCVMFDASALVCYITRFTEEIFATLIAFIFIFNSFGNLAAINKKNDFYPKTTDLTCECNTTAFTGEELFLGNVTSDACVQPPYNGTMVGPGCSYHPNAFLMSVILFLGAFTISYGLKIFRNTGFFPSWVRVLLSDFAVIIAILTMTGLDFAAGVDTPKLIVPAKFKPTWEGRDWMIAHAQMFSDHVLSNPWWVDVFLAPVLALLATILIFMDQQITAVIINRKDNKLKKGCGYHLDLFVLAFLIAILSIFGLPWFVAATVESRNHILSLSRQSTASAPGEKPQFLGIREQRVTPIMIGLCIGLSVFLTPILKLIPMPVLYGIFLFMGVRSLAGLQFFDRLLLLFMPRKYLPDYVYLRLVRMHRVHLFTIVQLVSLIGLWLIKQFPSTSIAFPVMLVVICAIRVVIKFMFSRQELRVLDDLLPEKGKEGKRGARYKEYDFEAHAAPEKIALPKMDVNEELETLMNHSPKFHSKKHHHNLASFASTPARSPIMSRHAHKHELNLQKRREALKRKVLVYLKLEDDHDFIGVHLSDLTMKYFRSLLQDRFEALQDAPIRKIIKETVNGVRFQLDDDLILYMENGQAFQIKSTEVEDGRNVILKEVQL